VREIEFARRLTDAFDVFCLKWDDALHVDAASALGRRARQVGGAVASAVAPRRIERGADSVTYVGVPVLQPILLRRVVGDERAQAIAKRRNHRVLESVLRDCAITHALLASEAFGIPEQNGVKVFFDLVDWFPEEAARPEQLAAIRARLAAMARRAQGVFAVSEPLAEKIAAECGIAAVPVPNGADLARLRGVDRAQIEAVRQHWGLAGKYVLGYIGNHGPYTGVDFVVEVFRAVRKRMPDAVLLIVGPADCWRSVLDASRGEGVIATGGIPPSEVAAYFNAIDLGILAQEKTAGTEFAFQIKVVEYSACRKFVISTPLKTWQRLAWPNVLLTPLNVPDWVAAIERARTSRWQSEWDAYVAPYDWRALAARLASVMLGETNASSLHLVSSARAV
jgi:glycosyltransferase involved in cell wall biosynthesis